MSKYEIIGLIGTLIVLISYTFTKTKYIRIVNCIGSVFFIVYGILVSAFSTALLNSACLVIHTIKLIQESRQSQHTSGSVLIVYHGIDKHELSKSVPNCISANIEYFANPIDYIDFAIDAANRGKVVVIDFEQAACDYLSGLDNVDVDVFLIFPDERLVYDWQDKLPKGYRSNYLDDVEYMKHLPFIKIVIHRINYNLEYIASKEILKNPTEH